MPLHLLDDNMHDAVHLNDNHFFINAASTIEALIQPLKQFGIHLFSYIKNYKNGTQIYLSNNAQWIKDYYSLKLYTTSLFEKDISQYSTGSILWPIACDSRVYSHGREFYNSYYGITLIETSKDSCEFYFFSSIKQNNFSVINFYHNNVDIFERFIIYFKDRAEKILRNAEKSKIIIPNHYNLSTDNFNREEPFKPNAQLKKSFFNETRVYHYTFNDGHLNGVKLSKRELDCIVNLSKNLSAAESAKLLNISPRTVESYLENVKLKLSCKKNMELLEKVRLHRLNLDRL